MRKNFQNLIKLLLPLAFGIGIVWFIMQKVDMEMLKETIRNGISWWWVVISWIFALLANVFRGIRWRQQLHMVDINPTLHEMSVSFFGNYGTLFFLVWVRFGAATISHIQTTSLLAQLLVQFLASDFVTFSV